MERHPFARVELYREVCAHLLISLVDKGNRDLFSLVRANLVGGPSSFPLIPRSKLDSSALC